MNNQDRKMPVLFVGNEPMLSKASAELLKRAGYKVRTTNPVHAANAVRELTYAAVVLCATLESDEAEEIIRAVSTFRPGTPIVSIHLGLLGDGPNPGSSIVVDALNGPQALIQAVDAVAHPQPHPIPHAI